MSFTSSPMMVTTRDGSPRCPSRCDVSESLPFIECSSLLLPQRSKLVRRHAHPLTGGPTREGNARPGRTPFTK